MPKFRKKPVVIEAVQFTLPFPHLRDLPDWLHYAMKVADVRFSSRGNGSYLIIETLEGPMEASPGDWIIQGVNGEFYPCKPDIFAATYEPVEE